MADLTSMDQASEIKTEIHSRGADFVYFVDISHLSQKQNKGYPNAILFGMALLPESIHNHLIDKDEFSSKEVLTDQLADLMAAYIAGKGFSAYSQSEANIIATSYYDERKMNTPLPHKTIAGLAGFGWIGKHNLLLTSDYGSAVSICTVLTDAPLSTVSHSPAESKCGDCNICKDLCEVGAIKGETWTASTIRDDMLDVNRCTSCLKCLVFCPLTQEYLEKIQLK